MDKLFIKESLREFKQTGSLVSSSKRLTEKMLSDIDFSQELRILELGAGSGIFTKHILGQMSKQSTLTVFECNPTFVAALKSMSDERLEVVPECVSTLSTFEKNTFDVVVSGLPLANFKQPFKEELFRNIQHVLSDSGKFVQFQYFMSDYSLFKKAFSPMKLDFCLLNVPPAFIYRVG